MRWVIGTGSTNGVASRAPDTVGEGSGARRQKQPTAVPATPAAVPALRAAIVNADDFGRAPGVNAGVFRAHEEGIVTSASLMVRWPDSDDAAEYARSHPALSLGLHLDLGEWVRISGEWEAVYEVVPNDDADAVRAEVANQLGRFHKLIDRSPTHIDSHQHVHLAEPVRSVVSEFARRLAVPLRQVSAGVAYCGGFYGQGGDGSPYPEGITARNLVRLFDSMGPGVTELSCHPGLGHDAAYAYSRERETEVAILCDPVVRRAISEGGVELVSYGALRRAGDDSFERRDDAPAA